MTKMSNAGVAVFVTDTTPMCRLRSDGAAALLSACSLVSCCSYQFVFPCLEVLLQGTPAPCTISCKALPGHIVDVDSLHISYADIVIRQVRAASGSPPQCQLTVEDVFWNATIIHTADMTQPSQSALSNQSVHTGKIHTGKTTTRQDISVGYFVLSGYAQDTADASQVERVEPSLLPGVCCPCLAAIQKCAGNTCIVDRHLCLHRQLGSCPHSSRETSKS